MIYFAISHSSRGNALIVFILERRASISVNNKRKMDCITQNKLKIVLASESSKYVWTTGGLMQISKTNFSWENEQHRWMPGRWCGFVPL